MNIIQNCLAATKLISKGQHVKLNTYDRLSLSVHLVFCKYCKSFEKDMEYVKKELHQLNKEENHFLSSKFKKELNEIVLAELKK
jgi:hypothetical protein